MAKETRKASVDKPGVKGLLEKDREKRRECWQKQPAQNEEHPLGLPDNSEERPSFDAYGRYLHFASSPKAIMPRGSMTPPELDHTLDCSVSSGPSPIKHSPSQLLFHLLLIQFFWC